MYQIFGGTSIYFPPYLSIFHWFFTFLFVKSVPQWKNHCKIGFVRCNWMLFTAGKHKYRNKQTKRQKMYLLLPRDWGLVTPVQWSHQTSQGQYIIPFFTDHLSTILQTLGCVLTKLITKCYLVRAIWVQCLNMGEM